jgi:DNA-binding PadR family transcriptional regulator
MGRRGLVRSRRDGSSARQRKVYEITREGRAVLRAWLAEPPERERPRSEAILKTFLGDQAPPGVIVGHLRELAERMEHRAESLRQSEAHVRAADAGTRALVYTVASIRAGIHICEARAAWARECIELIEASEKERS